MAFVWRFVQLDTLVYVHTEKKIYNFRNISSQLVIYSYTDGLYIIDDGIPDADIPVYVPKNHYTNYK